MNFKPTYPKIESFRLGPWLALSAAACVACSASQPAQSPVGSAAQAAGATSAPPPEVASTPEPEAIEAKVLVSQGSLLPPLPRAVTSFGAASSEGTLVVLGGYSGTPHAYSREGQSNDVWALARGETSWRKVAELDESLQGLAAVSHGERVCHFGGNHAANEEGTKAEMHSVTTARCLDPSSGKWTNLPELPRGRSSHAVALVGDTVYVVGGWTLDGDAASGQFADDMLALDLKKPDAAWRSSEVPFKRRALGAAGVGRYLVAVGGMTQDGEVSARVDVFDTETGEWSEGPAYPQDAFGIAVTSQEDRAFASARDGTLRSFVPGQEKWQDVRPLGFARFFHEMIPVGEDLVVMGGISGMHTRGRTRIVERVPASAELSYGQLEIEYPGAAKNRQGIFISGEGVQLFGGNVSMGQHDFEPEHFSQESWRLNLSTLSFERRADLPVARQSFVTVDDDDGGLALGGFGHPEGKEGPTAAVSRASVLSYDWQADSWAKVGELPRGRTQFGVAHADDQVWIFGGLNYDPERDQPFVHETSIWVADATAESPQFEALDVELPGPRRAFAGAALEGKYYLIGGMREGFQLVDDCLSFDFASRKFASMACPSPRLSGDLVAVGGKLYLVGGSVKTESGLEESRHVEVYDPDEEKWLRLDFTIPFGTKHLRAVPYREQILLLSTHQERDALILGLLHPPHERD